MKEFWIYTGLRVLLFLVTWAAIAALWVLIAGTASGGLTAIIAFVVSGIGSYVVLRGPRERFARRVETRASNATARFEEMRAKEDVD